MLQVEDSASIQGYLRAGCVHLTVDVLLNSEQAAHLRALGARRLVQRLLKVPGCDFWNTQHALVRCSSFLAGCIDLFSR